MRNSYWILAEAVRAGLAETEIILDTYELSAHHIDPIAEEVIQDLDELINITIGPRARA